MKIIEYVSRFIGLSVNDTNKLANAAPRTYKGYNIPKPNGGKRWINQPSRKTKALQYAILSYFVNIPLVPHGIAMAYRRKTVGRSESPLVHTANKHASYPYSVRVDFEGFFHCITPTCLESYLNYKGVELEDEDVKFLSKSLFQLVRGRNASKTGIAQNEFLNGIKSSYRLAIGAPSSPMVSNLVMEEADNLLVSCARGASTDYALTRYADDVVFSSGEKGACLAFVNDVREKLVDMSYPTLRLNERKTAFMSRGTRRMIVGMIITPDGRVTIGRSRKRVIKSMLNSLKYDELDPGKVGFLKGMLAWVSDVEPGFINRLTIKYGSTVLEKAKAGVSAVPSES